MNNFKTYKKFIYILILLLAASCSQKLIESDNTIIDSNVKSVSANTTIDSNAESVSDNSAIDANAESINKTDSEAKVNPADDQEKIFVINYGDNEYKDGMYNKRKHATITAVGDVILNWAIMKEKFDERAKKYGKKNAISYPFSKVKKEMVGIGFCNLEAPITDLDMKAFSDKDEMFYFNSPGGSEDILTIGGFDVVSLANNHIMDAGKAGMFDTYKRLAKKGIIPVGVGKNIDEALKPVYVNDKGIVIAIFAFSTVIPKSVWAGPDKAGAAGGSTELLCAAVKRVSRKADAIFVSIHWGEEVITDFPVNEPDKEQVELAHKLIDAGVTCIVGHHSHALGPVERYKGGIIFYSLGDFVFAGRHSAAHETSIMAQISLSRSGLESYTLIPVNINPLVVEYAPEILDEKSGREVINRILRNDKYPKNDKDSKKDKDPENNKDSKKDKNPEKDKDSKNNKDTKNDKNTENNKDIKNEKDSKNNKDIKNDKDSKSEKDPKKDKNPENDKDTKNDKDPKNDKDTKNDKDIKNSKDFKYDKDPKYVDYYERIRKTVLEIQKKIPPVKD